MSDRGDLMERLARIVEQRPSGDDDVRASTFARGLALGALVGAAIAGSTIWQRRHTRPVTPPAEATRDAPDQEPPAS
jgi:hypothetical protein